LKPLLIINLITSRIIRHAIIYLVDEAENTGKGANSVVSMVHHYFSKFGHEETDAKIHFDNCTGQNKNNVVFCMPSK
jgi:hypothetical protein